LKIGISAWIVAAEMLGVFVERESILGDRRQVDFDDLRADFLRLSLERLALFGVELAGAEPFARCFKHLSEMALRRAGKGYVLGVKSNQLFHSWGKPRPCCTEASKGATAPSWNHLRNADEIGLPEFTHSVERFDRDGNFGHTASVFARLQGISDDALVATDRRFNFRAPVVASRLLPVHPPVRIDRENMLVSLGWRCRGRWPSRGSFAWRHDEFRRCRKIIESIWSVGIP
jgi:hypothetical protein